MEKQNIVAVFVGPSGVGKDSVVAELIKKYPDKYARFVGTTTRPKRPGEKHGVNYFYVDEARFKQMLDNGEVFEHTFHYGAYRGMSKEGIEQVWKEGKTALKDCNMDGVTGLRKAYGKNAIAILVKAPRDVVLQRLKNRGDCEETQKIRIADYDEMMKLESQLDFSINNKDLEKAAEDAHRIIENIIKKQKQRSACDGCLQQK